MLDVYESKLDLNLLRVLLAVADTGGVTQAAKALYVTQPAVSAALRRLADALGYPVVVRNGRGIELTAKGARLAASTRDHIGALLDSTKGDAQFSPKLCRDTIRLGLSDAGDLWLLPKLLKLFQREAPAMAIVSVPVQFRTVERALLDGVVDMAVTVADEMPKNIQRAPLFITDFVCLFDRSKHPSLRRVTERFYFEADHVIVSYNRDLRGIVEDLFGKQRKVRCSVGSFAGIANLVRGTKLLATVPRIIATHFVDRQSQLTFLDLPFSYAGAPTELFWRDALTDDPKHRYIRDAITRATKPEKYANLNV